MNRFADFSRRHIITAAFVVFVEVLLYSQYAALNAEFHFWLHGLFGAAIGLFALALWKLLKPASPKFSPFEAGFLGHLYSAIPDIIFIAFGVLHMYWMDVFALHISIHFIPSPVLTMLAVFLLCLVGYGLAADGYHRPSAITLGIAITIVSAGLIMRTPMPSNLKEVQNHSHAYAWLCPMLSIDEQISKR